MRRISLSAHLKRQNAKLSEAEILSKILAYLKLTRIYAWRNSVGATVIGAGEHRRFVRFGHSGLSDIIGILSGGRFLAIEVKSAKGRITPEQRAFLDNIEERGGVAFVARSVEDVYHGLEGR